MSGQETRRSESPLKGRSLGELQRFFTELGEPTYRALQAFRRLNRHLAAGYDEFSEFSLELRQRLSEEYPLPTLEEIESTLSRDGTAKTLFRVPALERDGEPSQIETVWLVAPRRKTVCLSSQVGCSLNCAFCATGKLPFRGNLPAWAIVDQVYAFMRQRGERPTNIVFMGMGEPFYNYDNVLRAAQLLHHPEGLNIGAGHITISTAGVIPGIERFIREREPFQLAISLNHPESSGRGDLMDINRRYPLDKLLNAARKYTRTFKRKITFEYIMIAGKNMSKDHARQLIKIARSVNCKLNLIPLNTSFADLRRPTDDQVQDFQEQLFAADIAVFNRGSPGRDIKAACGMLALERDQKGARDQ